MNNPHYHSKENGCDCEETTYLIKEGGRTINGFKLHCNTHDIDACRCGWEFGWHYGTNSRAMLTPREERVKKTFKKICPVCGEEFSVNSSGKNRVCCSRECARIKLTAKRVEHVAEKCLVCGKEIINSINARKRKYCSQKCFRNKKWITKQRAATT